MLRIIFRWLPFYSYCYVLICFTRFCHCCCTAITIILLFIFLKAKTWKRFSLNEESDSTVNKVDGQNVAIGSLGRTIARLAPTGKALIDDQLVEVHAINKFIDPDRPIKVVGIEGYRIDVIEVPNDDRFEDVPNGLE